MLYIPQPWFERQREHLGRQSCDAPSSFFLTDALSPSKLPTYAAGGLRHRVMSSFLILEISQRIECVRMAKGGEGKGAGDLFGACLHLIGVGGGGDVTT